MRRFLISVAGLAVLGAGAFWIATAPRPLAPGTFAGLEGNAARGEAVFHAAGCASCHAAPGASGDDRLVLAGGQRFATAFGTFIAPNISSDPVAGIGAWTLAEFANAVMAGVSPEGEHYYPAFPYTAYANMTLQDMADLYAHLATLPASATPSAAHEVGFPFNIRRSLGGWKLLFQTDGWVVEAALTEAEARGRYLAEALAHCGECHTPRNALGGLDRARWLAGGPNPNGQGRIPNITPARLSWSEGEIVAYLTSGFTPGFDSVGGHMALVVENFAKLPEADRAAVAAYLKRVAPVD